jgi:RNA polymerase sigma-70 factor, ECF subfamily
MAHAPPVYLMSMVGGSYIWTPVTAAMERHLMGNEEELMPTLSTVSSSATEVVARDAATDEQIVDRVLAGDVALFEVLMRRNNPRVYRTLRALLTDETEAEDAMQAVYLNAFAKLGTFRGGARFSTWLTQIAVNEGLDRRRRDRRHPVISLASAEESDMPQAVDRQATPEALTSSRELAGLLEQAIDSLPAHYRLVFMLRTIEGMDTAEAAAALEVIKTRLSRARAILRGTLERMVEPASREAFGFHASRCDRVVMNVMQRIAT